MTTRQSTNARDIIFQTQNNRRTPVSRKGLTNQKPLNINQHNSNDEANAGQRAYKSITTPPHATEAKPGGPEDRRRFHLHWFSALSCRTQYAETQDSCIHTLTISFVEE